MTVFPSCVYGVLMNRRTKINHNRPIIPRHRVTVQIDENIALNQKGRNKRYNNVGSIFRKDYRRHMETLHISIRRSYCRQFTSTFSFLLFFLCLNDMIPSTSSSSLSKKFKHIGPVVTLTLKEPHNMYSANTPRYSSYQNTKPPSISSDTSTPFDLNKEENPSLQEADKSTFLQQVRYTSKQMKVWMTKKMNMSNRKKMGLVAPAHDDDESWLSPLSPSLTWSIKSIPNPFPNMAPSLRFMAWNLFYQHNPTFFYPNQQSANTYHPFCNLEDTMSYQIPLSSSKLTTPPFLRFATQIQLSTRFFIHDVLTPFTYLKQLLMMKLIPRNDSKDTIKATNNNSGSTTSWNSIITDRKNTIRHWTARGIPLSLHLIPIQSFYKSHQQPSETSLIVQCSVGESILTVEPTSSSSLVTSFYDDDPKEVSFHVAGHFTNNHRIQPSSSSTLSSDTFTTRGKFPLVLQSIHGLYYIPKLPSFTSLQALSIQPSYDLETNSPTCVLQTHSLSGRTTATLDLNWDDSTFTILHTIDDYNTISPQISLSTSSIIYQWAVYTKGIEYYKNNRRSRGSMIHTRVDPLSSIDVTWIDPTTNDSDESIGKWITQIHLPLSLEQQQEEEEERGIHNRWKSSRWKSSASSRRNSATTSIWRPTIRVRRSFTF